MGIAEGANIFFQCFSGPVGLDNICLMAGAGRSDGEVERSPLREWLFLITEWVYRGERGVCRSDFAGLTRHAGQFTLRKLNQAGEGEEEFNEGAVNQS